ncbi:hypothetical protein R3P38DRAFT_1102250 [Favolaschia claudopus]|uniref:F-box domain-containing protein n=1 Tax=Favolaschia claudopus TaxID=2862362 RepID=A0AAW0BAZ3_9AGAR
MYYNECCSALAPIRRIPIELLVEIFRLHDTSKPDLQSIDVFGEDEYPPYYGMAMDVLSHAPLVAASHVCARWRAVIVGTPFLWDTVELDAILWGPTHKHENQVLAVLEQVLNRGQPLPLKFTMKGRQSGLLASVLHLLAQHSLRWKVARISCHSVLHLEPLLSLGGKLPLLEKIGLWGYPWPNAAPNIFGDAPRLRTLQCSLESCEHFPQSLAQQLETVACYAELQGSLIDGCLLRALHILPYLSSEAEFQLTLALYSSTVVYWHEASDATDDIITSSLSEFVLIGDRHLSLPHILPIMTKIFGLLALIELEVLQFVFLDYTTSGPLPWPHTGFLALATRSDFGAHLTDLKLLEVAITDGQLLECLAQLPKLEYLEISDHSPRIIEVDTGDADDNTQWDNPALVLVNDSLLLALACEPLLVPSLEKITFRSMLKFTDPVLYDMCVVRGRSMEDFQVDLHWISGYHRDLDVAEKLNEAEFVDFCFGAAPGEE